jgi:two-component system, LytTR family, sensor kinase
LARNSTSAKKNKTIFAAIFSVWWAVWGMLHITVLQNFGIAPFTAMIDGVVSYLLLAGLCLLAFNNLKYYLPKKEKYLYMLVTGLLLSTLWWLLARGALKIIFKADLVPVQFFLQTSSIRFAIAFLMISCSNMLGMLWYTQIEQQKDNRRQADMEQLARNAELNKLQQQFQPHFLFNSLNSISALTGSQPQKARHMINQLADFLRGSLKREEHHTTTLEEELEYLQLYLDIEKVRFGHRLQTAVEKDAASLQMKLPAMILQPLVENAIKFGLYDTLGEVIITIKTKNNNGMLQVSVQNPFDEQTAAPQKGTGFGLTSIHRRLFLLFGRQQLLVITKEAGQFIATVDIPQAV